MVNPLTKRQHIAMSITLESAVDLLGRPVLEVNPFPGAVACRSEAALERFAGYSAELRAKVEGDFVRLRGGTGPEDWELAALDHALREWRIYEAFRRLHDEGWCPGLLFRLSTKTDLLTLCDPKADSSAAGFTERIKKVLAKRGIDHRFKWREARRLVAAMDLLEQPPPGDQHDLSQTEPVRIECVPSREEVTLGAGAAPADSARADAVLLEVHAQVGSLTDVIRFALERLDETQEATVPALIESGLLRPSTDPAYILLTEAGLERALALIGARADPDSACLHPDPEEGISCDSPDPEQEGVEGEIPQATTGGNGVGLPEPRLDRVWMALPGYKKAQLEAVHKRLGCGLWAQFAERFSPSFKKPEMLSYVQRLVRFYANLDAVQYLTDRQVDDLFQWMRPRLHERVQRDPDLRIAARLFGDFLATPMTNTLSPDAWNRYRDAEIRRIGAFCYHLFYAEAACASR